MKQGYVEIKHQKFPPWRVQNISKSFQTALINLFFPKKGSEYTFFNPTLPWRQKLVKMFKGLPQPSWDSKVSHVLIKSWALVFSLKVNQILPRKQKLVKIFRSIGEVYKATQVNSSSIAVWLGFSIWIQSKIEPSYIFKTIHSTQWRPN